MIHFLFNLHLSKISQGVGGRCSSAVKLEKINERTKISQIDSPDYANLKNKLECLPTTIFLALLIEQHLSKRLYSAYVAISGNGTPCIRHQCRKTGVLSLHRFLINSGVEKMNNIQLWIRTLTTRCLQVRVNVCIQTIVYVF